MVGYTIWLGKCMELHMECDANDRDGPQSSDDICSIVVLRDLVGSPSKLVHSRRDSNGRNSYDNNS